VVPDGVDEFGLISQGTLTISGVVSEGMLEREIEIHQGEARVTITSLFPASSFQ